MTRNRKAELQRKLAIAPLPTPPSELSQRIKDEIPRDLMFNVPNERDRFRRSVTFDMRIAASILLLISGAFAGVHFLSRPEPAMTTNSRAEAPAFRVAETTTGPAAQAAPLPSAAADSSARILPAAAPPSARLIRRTKEEAGAPALIGEMKASVPAGVSAPDLSPNPTAQSTLASADTATAAGLLQRAPDAIAGRTNAPPKEKADDQREAGNLVMADAAHEVAQPTAPRQSVAAPSSRAETSVRKSARSERTTGNETGSFGRAEEALRKDQRLDATAAAAFIEHFSAPTDRPAQQLRLEAEAIVLPTLEPHALFLRVSIDAPAEQGATSLQVTIPSLKPGTPAIARSIVPELRAAASMTRVFLLPLRPGTAASDSVALARLQYRDAGGREQSLERRIARADVLKWEKASARGRSATLAAAFIARLEEGKAVAPLAALARENGLEELAALIDAASR
ncbi:MAG: hypothetical protein ABIP63_06240 [Thermoanaerobaculia bacterium]